MGQVLRVTLRHEMRSIFRNNVRGCERTLGPGFIDWVIELLKHDVYDEEADTKVLKPWREVEMRRVSSGMLLAATSLATSPLFLLHK
jgi:hypothetical protein